MFLFVVCNYPVVLSRGLHWAQLAPEREFMEKVAMCVKDKEERTVLPACAPYGPAREK